MTDTGHTVLDCSLDVLICDLKHLVHPLPATRPFFPFVFQTPTAARWALTTMATVVRLLHEVLEEPLPKEWVETLDGL